MTKSIIKSAGYIVTDKAQSAIYGYGPSADEAWASLVSEMSLAGVTVVGEIDDAEISVSYPHETPANNYKIFAATGALLAAVDENGGNISWGRRGLVACLPSEE